MVSILQKNKVRLAKLKALCGAAIVGLMCAAPVSAQDSSKADANNPLANVTAFNLQNYYFNGFTGLPDDADGNQFVLRYAKPLSLGDTNWLLRASLPFNRMPVGGGGSSVSGMGDVDLFMAYQFDTKPGVSFGIGPQVVAPTASDSRLGGDQWQLGLANVYFNGTSAKFQYGYLLTYRAGVGGAPKGRDNASFGAFQPFWFYQIKDGWYTGGAPIWTYDFNSDNYNIPFGLRIGKVHKFNNTTANFFLEPQWSLASRGDGQAEFQLYAAINLQFK
ncbi:hypothetical protein [uncultured Pelagimonas sp.]|uniref:hypothetical protein n=1 Tax=uncultured Pelagimonas sp. TaxID=1618102 RepID=UPI00260DC03D|nr:hypothetical protein [uncultured Pelagimonas sp.]